jgi:glucose-6-phosphate isomerase
MQQKFLDYKLELLFLQVGATGKALTNVVSVGIGGSFLGPLFVHTALQTGKLLRSQFLGFLGTPMYFN